MEHTGIKIELTGQIEQNTDKKNPSRFISMTRDLEPPGIINNEITNICNLSKRIAINLINQLDNEQI